MKTIPDYSTLSRDELIDKTTGNRIKRAEMLKNAKAFDHALDVRLAASDARYHAAYLALLELTQPFDAAAAKRGEQTKAWHRAERDRHLAVALGTQHIQRHDAEAMGQVRA